MGTQISQRLLVEHGLSRLHQSYSFQNPKQRLIHLKSLLQLTKDALRLLNIECPRLHIPQLIFKGVLSLIHFHRRPGEQNPKKSWPTFSHFQSKMYNLLIWTSNLRLLSIYQSYQFCFQVFLCLRHLKILHLLFKKYYRHV